MAPRILFSCRLTGNPPQQPAGGSYAVDFDPFWNIATGALLGPTVTGTLPEISQTFLLPAGSYILSFDGAVEEGVLPQTRPLTVTLSGAATLNQTVTSDESDSPGYNLFSFDFDSTGGSVTLAFIPNDFSPEPNFMLDNVSVTRCSGAVIRAACDRCLGADHLAGRTEIRPAQQLGLSYAFMSLPLICRSYPSGSLTWKLFSVSGRGSSPQRFSSASTLFLSQLSMV